MPTVLKDPLGQDNIRRQGKGDPNIPTSSANCEYKNKKSIVVSLFVTLCLITKKLFQFLKTLS